MKKLITIIFSIVLSLNIFASSNDEYTIQNEHKTFTSIMKIIVKNNKIVSVSYDRKNLDSKSWVLDTAINQKYKELYGETFREMKTKLIRSSQSKGETLPMVGDKELYDEFKKMFEYLLEKIVANQNGNYQYSDIENKE